MFNLPRLVVILVLINVGVFAALHLLPKEQSEALFEVRQPRGPRHERAGGPVPLGRRSRRQLAERRAVAVLCCPDQLLEAGGGRVDRGVDQPHRRF